MFSFSETFQSSAASDRSSKFKKMKAKPSSSLTYTSEPEIGEKTAKFAKSGMETNPFITVETVNDNLGNLVQLKFLNNVIPIPAKVIKLIGLLVPFHKHLTNITINSGIGADTIYEISKFLPASNITELCLDGAFIAAANYDLLLTKCHLKYLSISKCKITDAVVKTIVDKLYFNLPASKSLSALNLSTNRVTDVGAKHLAEVLRLNRQLCYLNLADNMITDEGAISILDVLHNFHLTPKELKEYRSRYMRYLKTRNDLIESYIMELNDAEAKKVVKKKNNKPNNPVPSRRKSLERDTTSRSSMEKAAAAAQTQYFRDRARFLAVSKLGGFLDPFSATNTEEKDGCVYCYGNNALSYLNLAYNNISHITVKKLYEVLVTQKYLNRKPRGLVNVVIEGNNIPIISAELHGINEIIESNLSNIPKPSSEMAKRKSIAPKPGGKQSLDR